MLLYPFVFIHNLSVTVAMTKTGSIVTVGFSDVIHTTGNNKTWKCKTSYLKLSGSQVCNRIYQFVSLKKNNPNGSRRKRSTGRQVRVRNGEAYYHVGPSLNGIFQVWFPINIFNVFQLIKKVRGVIALKEHNKFLGISWTGVLLCLRCGKNNQLLRQKKCPLPVFSCFNCDI